MSAVEEANKSGKPCAMSINKNSMIYCKTHNQGLLYLYYENGKFYCRCQIGEDMTPQSRLFCLR